MKGNQVDNKKPNFHRLTTDYIYIKPNHIKCAQFSHVHCTLPCTKSQDLWLIIYSLYWDVTILDEGMQIYTHPWRLWPLIMNSEVILSCHTYCVLGNLFVLRAISQEQLHSYPLPRAGLWYCYYQSLVFCLRT